MQKSFRYWYVASADEKFEIRTFLSPDISQLVKFAGSDISQLLVLPGQTILSPDICQLVDL